MARERTTGGRGAHRRPAAPLVVYGANAVLELLRSGQPLTRLYLGQGPRADEIAAAARTRVVRAEAADRPTLERIAGTAQHQGAVAECPPFQYAPLERLLEPERGSALVLDGIQDPRNLGAILRTARAVGVGGVVLPRDRSVGVTPVVVGASAGMLFGLPIALVPNLVRAMGELKEAGFWLYGLVPLGGKPLPGISAPTRPALVVGGEGEGVRPLVLRACDFTVTIPMAPGVESLNVSVAAGIALYELLLRPRAP
jgi:23S rRNA (guanosine2251-2'-O)-methyltransferase